MCVYVYVDVYVYAAAILLQAPNIPADTCRFMQIIANTNQTLTKEVPRR